MEPHYLQYLLQLMVNELDRERKRRTEREREGGRERGRGGEGGREGE